jgi:predicted PolB exonuclease-like 3'-5' exonuclease
MVMTMTMFGPPWATSSRSTSITQSSVSVPAAHQENGHWAVDALGAPHVGERSEKALISSFVDRIAQLAPQLVTFNGSSFDLPVLRYRAMVHGVAAAGLSLRPYFNRYTDDAVDLCDVLSSFSFQGKATLHELCRVMGLPPLAGFTGLCKLRRFRDFCGRVCMFKLRWKRDLTTL